MKPIPNITPRELEVVRYLATRPFHGNKHAADAFGLSVKTIEKHRQRVYHTLRVHSTAELIVWLLRGGHIKLSEIRLQHDNTNGPNNPGPPRT